MLANQLKYWFLRYILGITTPKSLLRFLERKKSNAIILECDAYELSYSVLIARANKLANGLLSRGIKKGDRIALIAKNRVEFIELRLAAYKAGFVFCALIDDFSDEQMIEKIEAMNFKALFFDKRGNHILNTCTIKHPPSYLFNLDASNVENTIPYSELINHSNSAEPILKVKAMDTCAIGFTSGTTGTSKGVVWNNRAWISSFYNFLRNATPVSGGMIMLQFLPLSTVASLSVLPWLASGGKMILLQEYNAQKISRLITERKVTHLIMAPTFLIDLWCYYTENKEAYDFSSLKTISVGSESMSGDKLKRIIQCFGPIITQSYGMSENLAPLASLKISDPERTKEKLTSVGIPIRQIQVKLQDKDENGRGTILIKSPTTTQGYWSKSGLQTNAIQNKWYVTDDIGRFDKEGYLFLVGRKTNTIKINNRLIYPRSIEEILHTYPMVKEVCVLYISNQLTACYTAINGVEIDRHKLISFMQKNTDIENVPSTFIFLEDFPISSSGKILRHKIIETCIVKGKQF